jgi:hypothetical protein
MQISDSNGYNRYLFHSKHTNIMGKIRQIPKTPIEDERLAQCIDHEDGPEEEDRLFPCM